MFSGQGDKPRGAKQVPTLKGGAERRQRQMMSVRSRAHGEMMKHMREEERVLDGNMPQVAGDQPMDVWAYGSTTEPSRVPLPLLPQFVQLVVEGKDDKEVFQGTLMIRKILSVERDPPHDLVLQSGILPYMVQLLDRFDNPLLQFEAAWALTNIAAGTTSNVQLLVESDAIPRFIALLGSEHADCRDQAAWAIGNMAGDGVPIRDLTLSLNAMPALLHVMNLPDQPANVLRNATWAVSNLCRTKPSPPLEQVIIALPTLCKLLSYPDEEVVSDASWAISYISDGNDERVQAVLNTGILPRVVELLSASTSSLQTSAIRIIGNIAGGSDEQTQSIINAGGLASLPLLLTHRKREIRKETCWTISNIAAGTGSQIDALINANVFPPLISNCMCGTELDVRKEAVWAVANVTMCGSDAHVRYLLSCNVIQPICETLSTHDSKILTVSLEALNGLLRVGEEDHTAGLTEENVVAQMVTQCGGLDMLERLQTYNNHDVYTNALHILESYFAIEDNMGVPGLDFDTELSFGGVPNGHNDAGFDF